MPSLNLTLHTRRPMNLDRPMVIGVDAPRHLLNAITEAVSGLNQSDGIVWDTEDNGVTAPIGQAIALLVMATSSGAVGGTIGGQLTTVTWATSDTLSSTALAAAIRAQTAGGTNRLVTATNECAQLTLASVTAGQFIDIFGIRFTAVSGTPPDFNSFDISGTDTQDAASLCAAINSNPSTCLRYRAINVAGAVFVFRSTQRAAAPNESILNTGNFATITVNVAVPKAGARTAVIATMPGRVGNEIRLAASGTNVTAVTAGTAGLLGSGSGGGATPYFVLP